MGIDPRLLRILLAVAREGSLSAAAIRLNMSQPSVSIAIAQLEDRIGEKTVIRDRRGALLTQAGETLVRHAHAIENVLAHAALDLRRQAEDIDGPLVIGGTTGALLAIVPRVIGLLQGEGRQLDISLVEAKDDELVELVRRRDVDLALCPTRPRGLPHDLEETLLLREPFLLIAGRGTALPQGGLTVAQAARYPWVLPLAEGATRRQVEAMFLSAGVPLPQSAVRCDLLSTMKELVRQTGSLALLPASVVASELAVGLLHSVTLMGAPPPRGLVALKLRSENPSPLAKRFLAQAQTLQEL